MTPGSISLYLQDLWTALKVGALALINDKLTFPNNMFQGDFVFFREILEEETVLCCVFEY